MKHDSLIEKYVSRRFKAEHEGGVVRYEVHVSEIANVVNELYTAHGLPLMTIAAADMRQSGAGPGFKIFYVFGVPGECLFLAPYIVLAGTTEFPSITKDIHEASMYERKINTFFGLEPVGHPDPRPVILHENWQSDRFPLRKDFNGKERPALAHGTYAFHTVEGEGIYEIPVGPVHAGIIEPVHFRFSMAGEEIVRLEAKLGYKHRGVEKLFESLPLPEKVRLSERVSGDTSFTHSLAFCHALEELAGITVSDHAAYLRVIFSEMERLANHLSDIGFILQDTGYGFGGANGARLRERIMQWNERLSGNRYLRGLNVIGGVTKDIPGDVREHLVYESDGRDHPEVLLERHALEEACGIARDHHLRVDEHGGDRDARMERRE